MNKSDNAEQSLPTLTVAIPNFNHGHIIGHQLNAIFSQSIQPERIIIIDDASADDSVEVISRLIAGRNNVELICREKNGGVNAVLNQALQMSKTEYVTFPGADDLLLPGFFEKSLKLLARYPEAAICSTVTAVKNKISEWYIPTRTRFPCAAPGYLSPVAVGELLIKNDTWIMSNTTTVRRAALLEVGGYDSRLMSWADEFTYRVLALRHGACFIPEVLAINQQFETGYSSLTWRSEDALDKMLTMPNAVIKEKFSDLFPPGLLDRTNARLLFSVTSAKLEGFERRTMAVLNEIPHVSGSRIYIFGLKLSVRIMRYFFYLTLCYKDLHRKVLAKIAPNL